MKRAYRLFVTLFAMTTVLAVPTGTVARQTSTTDSETVTLVLPEEPCSVNIRHEDGDFGSWEWDSSLGWVRTTRDSTMTFWVMLSADTYNGCDVTVSFDGLKGTGETIGPGSFSTTFSGIAQAQTSFIVSGLTMVDYNLDYALDSIPEVVPPGTYTGVILVSVTNTA